MNPRMMRLGLSMRYLGYHIASWRHPDFDPAAISRFDVYRDVAKKAESEKLDMIFFADSMGALGADLPHGALSRDMRNIDLDPQTLLAAIAAVTDHIGLVSTASTTFNEPYQVARKYSSLDHISNGRAGWNLVTSWNDKEARNFNRDSILPKDERYDRAAEFVEVVLGLWNSFEPDAFVHDKLGGQFFDPAKRNVLNHSGKFFNVTGPLTSGRTPQGRPLIVQAGASGKGRAIAAQHADVVYTVSLSIEEARRFYADIKDRAKKYEREDGGPLIMPALTLYVGATRAEAQGKLDELQRLIDPLVGSALLYNYCGDLSEYDLDQPIPEHLFRDEISISGSMLDHARKEKMTIRELHGYAAAGAAGRFLVGTAEDIVDDMQEWFETGAADGFNFCPPMLPHGLDDLAVHILPELRRRGLFRTEYEGDTLRANLGF